MSLILKALNKAENERSGEIAQPTAASYSMPLPENNWRQRLPFGLLIIVTAAFALYLSAILFNQQPDAPDFSDQKQIPQAESNQHATEPTSITHTSKPLAPAPSVSSEYLGQPTSNIENDKTIRLQNIASAAVTANPYNQTLATTEKQHEQEKPQTANNTTLSSNPDTPSPLSPSTPQPEETALFGNEYPDTPIFQNLPQVVKSMLPPLELNIHVYSTNPLKSFVYINSKRYREGTTIENGITVERIIPTGVILRHQKILFRLVIKT